jgi:decaprenylphospho-beta-D-erythro-pentofuranosid-2-ulose 2-reductase
VSHRIESAVVFGGNSDLARATVERLARDGLRKVVLAVRDPQHAPAADALRSRGLDVTVVPFDADAVETHPTAVDAAFKVLGDVDLALVAFAVLGDQAVAEREAAAAVAVMQTNVVGTVSVLTLLGARMRAAGHGAIVLLSSVAAERARRANYVYGASKMAADAFAQGLADALVPAGVQVLVVRPGFVKTKLTAGRPRTPMVTTPETVAEAVAAGLRRGRHTVWAPAYLRWVFAVIRHLPRPLFRRIRG